MKQTTLVPIPKKKRASPSKFNAERRELRGWWKKYKVGMVKWEDIPENYQKLLLKYYPIK